jgi:hypothetical protein
MDGDPVVLRAWFTLCRHDLADAQTFTVDDDGARVLLDALVGRLQTQQSDLEVWDRYYRGTQPTAFLHPDLKLELGDRLESLVINFPRLSLDAVEERLDVEGFRLPGEDAPSDDLWRVWQSSGMDLASGRNHLRSLRHGRAFVSVWSGGKRGLPRIAVESAKQVVVDYYPGSTDVRVALKYWKDGQIERGNLYLGDRIIKWQRGGADSRGLPLKGWTIIDVVGNVLGVVPLVPFLNRYDEDMPNGESEITDAVHLADAINKLATDMMVTSEFHAAPRRWANGIDIPKGPEGDRLRVEAKKYLDNALTGKTWLGGKDTQFGQFPSADLTNFVKAIGMLTQHYGALAGLPPHMMGLHGDNPASADAIRSSEAALIKRVQRKQRTFGEPWEDVMRLAIRVRDGGPLTADEALETVWRSPETPTVAQKADAAVKLVNAGIIDGLQAQEDLGYTPQQRTSMAERRTETIANAVNAATAERIKLAMAMVGEGIDEKIAFAAVGLLITPKQSLPGEKSPAAPEGDPGTSGTPDSLTAVAPAAPAAP